jgi:hypothetical protein
MGWNTHFGESDLFFGPETKKVQGLDDVSDMYRLSARRMRVSVDPIPDLVEPRPIAIGESE